MSIVAFDLDGVVFDFHKHFENVYEKMYREKLVPKKNPTSDTGNKLEAIYDIPGSKIMRVVQIALSEEMIDKTPFIKGAQESLNKRFTKEPIIVVTKRNILNQKKIQEYLKEKIPNAKDIIVRCCSDPFAEKLRYIKDSNAFFFLDDRWDTCVYLRDNGIHAILCKTDINKGLCDSYSTKFSYPSVFSDWTQIDAFLNQQVLK